ncbi:NERD domain-containing protein [Bacillus sp. FJAT-49732]|uniref:NERD domain-containing protein n=1 Tax=Lederbergia citrisecunda TaxID=2833583 RepID=A0A942TPK7_9BACI|nr:nuclease-related domain-containing protein [Lederbergia citrisecunda]MBS4199944.1 NERD domain-containing protein [Lederbergia citrisecunda]
MFKKLREIPIKILILEALLRRLSFTHPKRNLLQEELSKGYAGYRGEQSMDYFLAQLPQDNLLIFQDLRLPLAGNTYFQIDILLITPSFFIIYEGKNILGHLYFDFNQLIRTLDDQEEMFLDPIVQVQNQQYHFENLIKKYFNKQLPNTSFVVVTNSSSKIEINPDYRLAFEKVIRTPAILQKTLHYSRKNNKEIFDKKDMQKLSRILLKLHTPAFPNVLEQFQITDDEILSGIYCESCQSLTIVKSYRKWLCTNCGQENNTAFIHALIDFYLLKGKTITNQQCKDFLQLSSSSISSKLLRTLNLSFIGTYRNRAYNLSLSDLQRKLVSNNKDGQVTKCPRK